MINQYINDINAALTAKLGNFTALINGIAQPVYIEDSEEVQIPAIIEKGEDATVFIDDDYDFGLYHKQRGGSYIEDSKAGYGDQKKITEIQDLSVIAWGFENKLTAEDLKDYFVAVSPSFVRFVSVSFDKKTIFNQEFKNVDFMVDERIFLMQINYKVQYDVKKSCLEINPNFNI